MGKKRVAKRRKPPAVDFPTRLAQLAGANRSREVIEACRRNETLVRTSPESLRILAWAQSEQGELADAVGTLEDALALIARETFERNEGLRDASSLQLAIECDLAKWSFERSDFARAAEILSRLCDQFPGQVELHRNLITAMEKSGDRAGALKAAKGSVELFPEDAQLAYLLADLISGEDQPKDTIAAFRRCLQLDPKHGGAWRGLVTAYRQLGDPEEVSNALKDWLEADPQHAVAAHLLSGLQSDPPPPRAADSYVKEVFDAFAETFDRDLAALEYSGPREIVRMLAERGLTPDASLRVLDAGCGTGLLASHIRPFASRLVGVDLSSGMLARAECRGYDELHQSELTEFLGQSRSEFDVIVSVDTLNYFGDLAAVFEACRGALKSSDSILTFSLELRTAPTPDLQAERGYTLNPSGRYAHDSRYVTETLLNAGFREPETVTVDLRKEADQRVQAVLWLARTE